MSFNVISAVDPVHNNEAFLVFDQLRVESFRKAGFTSHFTHLKYDCVVGWPYAYMPAAVAIVLVVLCAICVFFFLIRDAI